MIDKRLIEILILRSVPDNTEKQVLMRYEIPADEVVTVLDSLDYIRRNFDSSLAYYSHQACGQGMCGVCNMRVNNTPKLACQTMIEDKMVIEPLMKRNVVVDLVNNI
ncbi:MAG: 2Fe-2S iron-sulfur cluster-binding protein [Thermoplasmatales archaeon]|jgi:succinate dehydrogenase/fumarate reductase iron-sulfur protein|nr:2Fe-2S iron-sulfur cluster-binding protein [Thermoplasmatales archaeon]